MVGVDIRASYKVWGGGDAPRGAPRTSDTLKPCFHKKSLVSPTFTHRQIDTRTDTQRGTFPSKRARLGLEP